MASDKEINKKAIANWPEDERPRERLLSRGPHSLTDAEVLAILLRTGVKGKSAVQLGREILQRFGSLHEMMSAPLPAWDGIKGLGTAKLAQLWPIRPGSSRGFVAEIRKERFAAKVVSGRAAAPGFLDRLAPRP